VVVGLSNRYCSSFSSKVSSYNR